MKNTLQIRNGILSLFVLFLIGSFSLKARAICRVGAHQQAQKDITNALGGYTPQRANFEYQRELTDLENEVQRFFRGSKNPSGQTAQANPTVVFTAKNTSGNKKKFTASLIQKDDGTQVLKFERQGNEYADPDLRRLVEQEHVNIQAAIEKFPKIELKWPRRSVNLSDGLSPNDAEYLNGITSHARRQASMTNEIPEPIKLQIQTSSGRKTGYQVGQGFRTSDGKLFRPKKVQNRRGQLVTIYVDQSGNRIQSVTPKNPFTTTIENRKTESLRELWLSPAD
jgi:hypothetical protein